MKPMGPHGVHNWWYRRLTAAGIVPQGTTSGERMHKARHTAGQRVLDHTGNLKAVQQLLGHASIQTTGDIYTDWDVDQLAATMADVLDDDRPTDNEANPKSFPLNSRKRLQMRGIYRQRDSNPCYRRERAAS
jgi:integrase